MSSAINNRVLSNAVNNSLPNNDGGSAEISQDPLDILTSRIMLKILSNLDSTTFETLLCVSKRWSAFIEKAVIYTEVAFGNDKWAEYFGPNVVKDEDNEEEFNSLPAAEFIRDCEIFAEIFPHKNPADSLMLVRLPKTLDGGLTLNKLGELAKKYFPNSENGFAFVYGGILDEIEDTPIDRSRWVLMTAEILPESGCKNKFVQREIVAKLAKKGLPGYQVPGILEAAVCILSRYFASKERLFSDTNTRCEEVACGYNTMVGYFEEEGLMLSGSLYDKDSVGVAALRRF